MSPQKPPISDTTDSRVRGAGEGVTNRILMPLLTLNSRVRENIPHIPC